MGDVFSRYSIIGDVGPEKVKVMDQRVEWIRDSFSSNETLRRVLLNSGYAFEEGKDVAELKNLHGCFNRKKVLVHLNYLEAVRQKARSIHILTPDPESIDMEAFQIKWWRNHELRNLVSKYERRLLEALKEYDKGLCLNLWESYHSFVAPFDLEEHDIHKVLMGEFSTEGYRALDSAYYNMGNHHLRACSVPWKKLMDSEFGSLFVLDEETVLEVIGKHYK